MVWVACMCAYYVLGKELKRSRIQAEAADIVLITAFAGVVGAKLWHVLESPHELMANPFGVIFSREGFAWFGGLVAGITALLLLGRRAGLKSLKMLDLCATSAAIGYGVGRIGCLLSGDGDYGIKTSLPWGMSFPNGTVPTTDHVHPTPIYEFIAAMLIAWYLWKRGEKAARGPSPVGQIVGEYLILSGIARFLVEFIRINPHILWGMSNAQVASVLSIIAGIVIIFYARRTYRSQKGEHKIIEHHDQKGDVVQPEYHRATLECPEPQLWKMYDSMTAEIEVLDFLKSLITTLKPKLVVETGTFMGISTLAIAEGLKKNGFGKIISCEYDPKVYAKAKERFAGSGLQEWIDFRNESSLEMKVDGDIDLFFSDSDLPIREKEVRRFLPQISPFGLILMHDASSHLKTVRDAALSLEAEDLISTVLLSTPRGLVIAQKREGRK